MPPKRWAISSIIIIGQEIQCDDLWENVRSCLHKIDESSKFCPECGLPVWSKKVRNADKVRGLNVFRLHGTQRYFCGVKFQLEDKPSVFSSRARQMRVTDQGQNIPAIPDIPKIKEELKAKLEKANLWDEDKFGIWNLLEFI